MKKIDPEGPYYIARIVILMALLLFFLFGCSTRKIESRVNESRISSESLAERILILESRITNASNTRDVDIHTEKVEFFNPGEVEQYAEILTLMKERGEPYSDAGIVKSITGVNSKAKETQTSTVNESVSAQADSNKESSIDVKKTESIKTEIVPFLDKYKWQIGIGVVLVIIFIIFKFKLSK